MIREKRKTKEKAQKLPRPKELPLGAFFAPKFPREARLLNYTVLVGID